MMNEVKTFKLVIEPMHVLKNMQLRVKFVRVASGRFVLSTLQLLCSLDDI